MNSKNRVCLKKLAAINVDAQFCQLYGAKIFNNQNENDGMSERICQDYKDTLGDLVNNIKFLESEISVFEADAA